MGQLGADHQRDAEAEVRGLAPADVAVRRGGVVERDEQSRGAPASWVTMLLSLVESSFELVMTR